MSVIDPGDDLGDVVEYLSERAREFCEEIADQELESLGLPARYSSESRWCVLEARSKVWGADHQTCRTAGRVIIVCPQGLDLGEMRGYYFNPLVLTETGERYQMETVNIRYDAAIRMAERLAAEKSLEMLIVQHVDNLPPLQIVAVPEDDEGD